MCGVYRFDSLCEIRTDSEIIELWNSRDSLVLKAMTIVLGDIIQPQISARCFHVKGSGGIKGALQEVNDKLEDSSFVMKSDVKSYYASIDHEILLGMLEMYVQDEMALGLVWQYLRRTVTYGENYRDVKVGISLRCSLSPLMGALYLSPMDEVMVKSGYHYTRFMDDWIVITKTRWHLRKAVRMINQVLVKLKLEQHPDKTYIGKANKGLDFLGFTFTPNQISVSCKTITKSLKHITRLYEQNVDQVHIWEYVDRFWRWVKCVEPRPYANDDMQKGLFSPALRSPGPSMDPRFGPQFLCLINPIRDTFSCQMPST